MAKLTSELEQIFKFRISDYKDIPAYIKRLSSIGHMDAVRIEKLLVLILVRLGEMEDREDFISTSLDTPVSVVQTGDSQLTALEALKCPYCGKVSKSLAGNKAHQRSHKK